MSYSNDLEAAMAFAHACIQHHLAPVDLAEMVRLIRLARDPRATVAASRRQHVEAHATSIGLRVEWVSGEDWPRLFNGEREVFLPDIGRPSWHPGKSEVTESIP